MLERLRYRITGSVLLWDVLITLLCLYAASKIRLNLNLGNNLGLDHVQLPWELYAAVAGIWIVIFLLLAPQRALFSRGLLEAIGRLVGSVSLASISFAGLLYLTVRDVS